MTDLSPPSNYSNPESTTAWAAQRDLFESVLANPAGSEALLAQAQSPELAESVRRLLQAHQRHAGHTDQQLLQTVHSITQLSDGASAQAGPGSRIGPYQLREEIGRGGMGVVFKAERTDGVVQQTVAIKLLPPHRWDALSQARFQQERELAAQLDHPAIARLIDAGAFDVGGASEAILDTHPSQVAQSAVDKHPSQVAQSAVDKHPSQVAQSAVDNHVAQSAADSQSRQPYFVMEYVQGIPLDAYLKQHQPSLRERIQLLQKILSALDYAHRQLIVHRDLKPSNVLITNAGEPKLIDFGIAKHLQSADTQTAQRYFSPSFAAPEQLQANARSGVATDVYQCGTLLYLMLAGHAPFAHEAQDPLKLHAAVLKQIPKTPDAKQSDLSAIALKALRKDPNDRYASIAELAEDLRRFVMHRPVQAKSGALWYSARKFLRRNWVGLTVAGGVIALTSGFAWNSYQQAQLVLAERDRAVEERTKAQAITDYFTGVFKAASLQSGITANSKLSEFLASAESSLVNSEATGEIRYALAASLIDAATQVDSLANTERAFKIYVKESETLKSTHDRIGFLIRRASYESEVGKLDAAFASSLQALALARQSADAELLLRAVMRHSGSLASLQRLTQSIALASEAIAIKRRIGQLNAETQADYIRFLINFANGTRSQDPQLATEIGEFANGRSERDPYLPTLLRSIAFLQLDQGDPKSAQLTIDRSLRLGLNHFSESEKPIYRIRSARAEISLANKQLDEGFAEFDWLLKFHEERGEARTVDYMHQLFNKANWMLSVEQEPEKALKLLEQVSSLARAELGAKNEKALFFEKEYWMARLQVQPIAQNLAIADQALLFPELSQRDKTVLRMVLCEKKAAELRLRCERIPK
jgi:eukaryotic-like serine/threonine-protein kinase